MNSRRPQSWFTRFAIWAAHTTGRPGAFVVAATILVIWAVTGPLFHFSDTWQLVINTGTSVVTFLVVFLVQSTQNRDTEVLQLKLDEIIRALSGAQNMLLDLEQLDDKELDRIRDEYRKLAEKARARKQGRKAD